MTRNDWIMFVGLLVLAVIAARITKIKFVWWYGLAMITAILAWAVTR